MSMDVKYLYYSLEKSHALQLDLANFQSKTGLAVITFLSLLDLYLQAAAVEYSGQKYIQKDGVRLGSSVAPILETNLS